MKIIFSIVTNMMNILRIKQKVNKYFYKKFLNSANDKVTIRRIKLKKIRPLRHSNNKVVYFKLEKVKEDS